MLVSFSVNSSVGPFSACRKRRPSSGWDASIRPERTCRRPGGARAPGPGVAEPDRGQQVEGRRVRSPIVHRDADQDVLGRGLGVLHDHVEVAVLVEHAGVEQLVLHLVPPPIPVGPHQVVVRVRLVGILVEVLHVRVGRRGVEVEVVLLHVLAVVALAVGQAEEPLLQDGVLAVPQGHAEAEQLPVVRDAREPVLTPPVGPRAGLVVAEVIPGVSGLAVVLAHRAPLALAEVGSPLLPGLLLARLLEPILLRAHDALSEFVGGGASWLRFRSAAASIERMKKRYSGTLRRSATIAFTTVSGSPPMTVHRQ